MGEKGNKTKADIRKAAYGLFAAKGFKQVTMKDICEATGLSRGGLYRHYEGTGLIFLEILQELMQMQEDEFASKIQQNIPAPVILREVLTRYEKEMPDGKNSLSIAIYEFYSSPENQDGVTFLEMQYENSWQMWRRLLQYGMERGEFRQVDAKAVFDLLIFAYQGVRMYSCLMPISQEIPKGIMQQIQQLLLK